MCAEKKRYYIRCDARKCIQFSKMHFRTVEFINNCNLFVFLNLCFLNLYLDSYNPFLMSFMNLIRLF